MKRWSLGLAFLLAGCTATAPVIDELRMPQSATVGADGVYHVRGTISFHSESSLISKVRIAIPEVGQRYDIGSNLNVRGDTLDLDVQLLGATPRGLITYDVSVLDVHGVPSDARRLSVILQ